MNKAEAKELTELANRMLAELEKAPADRLLAAVKKHYVTIGFNDDMKVPLGAVCPTKAALSKTLAKRTPEVRSVALQLLAHIDKKSATAYLDKLLEHDLSGHPNGSDVAALAHSVRLSWQTLVGGFTPARLVEHWRSGRLRGDMLPIAAWDLISVDELTGVVAKRGWVPPAVFAKLPADTTIRLWMEATVHAERLMPAVRERISVEQIEAAWRAGAPGIALIIAKHPVLARPTAATALLEWVLEAGAEVRDRQPDALDALVTRLVEGKSPEAIPALARLAASAAPLVGKALSAIGAIDAREASRTGIEVLRQAARGAIELTGATVSQVVDTVLAADPAGGSEALAPFFGPGALESVPARATAAAILGGRAWAFRLHGRPEPGFFDADPRWIDLGARLLREPGFDARAFVASFDPAAVAAALERAGWKPLGRRPPISRPIPSKARWLERYKKGEHQEVWSEIRALQSSARNEAVRAEIEKVAREMAARVKKNLVRIVATLRKNDYPFQARPNQVITPPGAKTAKEIAELEKLLEAPLPIALRAFYEVVGAVNLAERADAVYEDDDLPFTRCGALDPIVVVTPKTAQRELAQAKREAAAFPPALREPETDVYIGPDPQFKIDPGSGGDNSPWQLDAQGEGADGMVSQGGRAIFFVDYLRRCVEGGGFFALAERTDEKSPAQRNLLVKGLLRF